MAIVVDDEASRTAPIAAVASRTAAAPALAEAARLVGRRGVSCAPSADCVVAPATSAPCRARVHGAHLALGAGGDLLDGAGDLAHGAPGVLGAVGELARADDTAVAVSDTGRSCGSARAGVVGLHRGRGVVADLAHASATSPIRRGAPWIGGVRGELEVRSPRPVPSRRAGRRRRGGAAGQARDDRLDAEADAADRDHAGTAMRKIGQRASGTSRRAVEGAVACRRARAPATLAS
jgi:hypothetical protein